MVSLLMVVATSAFVSSIATALICYMAVKSAHLEAKSLFYIQSGVIEREEPCHSCSGEGKLKHSKNYWKGCDRCSGSKSVFRKVKAQA